MSDHDETNVPPTAADAVPGGVPDPVVATAPTAPPAPDEPKDDAIDETLAAERPPVYPAAGPQSGVVMPPVPPRT
ncbi:hypothetical protein [Cellulomonas sp.]|uniref:hypothetical protein n=1 Tax=Cellulomonas sp. TaxID=40001 RepID=UPI00258D3D28|nr:hypothetical protein [Cellulomonas sp.]MCR6688889.1 hypothetical protein [Cellulomonas sp.]